MKKIIVNMTDEYCQRNGMHEELLNGYVFSTPENAVYRGYTDVRPIHESNLVRAIGPVNRYVYTGTLDSLFELILDDFPDEIPGIFNSPHNPGYWELEI